MKPAILIVLILGLVCGQTVSKVGTTAAPFLKIPVGARALGMGEAVVTQTYDVTAMYWNPAGLGDVSQIQVVLNHYEYFANLHFDYVGVAFPAGQAGTLGMNFTYFGGDDIERTTEEFQDGSGELISYGFYAIGMSFGSKLTNRFSIGGNLKYIKENLWHESASGAALDVGILYRTQFKNTVIGMSISNFGTSMKQDGWDLLVQHDIDDGVDGNNENINASLGTDEFKLPIFFRVGISNNITRDLLGIEDHDLILAVDAVHPNDNLEYLNVGAEYNMMNMIKLRMGHRQLLLDNAEGGLSFGGGIHYDFPGFSMDLDYAALDFGRLDFTNKFTLLLTF